MCKTAITKTNAYINSETNTDTNTDTNTERYTDNNTNTNTDISTDSNTNANTNTDENTNKVQIQTLIQTQIQGTILVTSRASQAKPRVHNCPRPLRHAELQSVRSRYPLIKCTNVHQVFVFVFARSYVFAPY